MRQFQLGWRAVCDMLAMGDRSVCGQWLAKSIKTGYFNDICISAVLIEIVTSEIELVFANSEAIDGANQLSKAVRNNTKFLKTINSFSVIPADEQITKRWFELLKLESVIEEPLRDWSSNYSIKLADIATAIVGRFGQGFHYVDVQSSSSYLIDDIVLEIPGEINRKI